MTPKKKVGKGSPENTKKQTKNRTEQHTTRKEIHTKEIQENNNKT
jgi:hypothetical protein